MNKYRVMLEGSNVALVSRRWFRKHQERYGFYTTRYVVAEDVVGAEALAVALVRAELQEKSVPAFDSHTILIQVESIEELSAFENASVPGRGFVFFPEGKQA